MTIIEFLGQLPDPELAALENLIHLEYRDRAQRLVQGGGHAVREVLHLAEAMVVRADIDVTAG